MPRDAYEGAPDYPAWPRDAEGRPIIGPGPAGPMPEGFTMRRRRDRLGNPLVIDQRLRDPVTGEPVVPPDLPPGP